jgi:HSP20 family protein
MTIVRYEPWRLMSRVHRDIDKLFGEYFTAPDGDADRVANWAPPVDVHEEPGHFTIHADLPGVESKDIHVTADNGVLVIRGERRIERSTEQKGFERLERSVGSFLRRFTLPENVKADEIKARHVNGVLEVTIPKQAVPEPRRVNVEVN